MARLAAVGLTAPALALTATPVLPAVAAPGDAVVVELPREARGEPRHTTLVGRTDSGMVVVTDELDSSDTIDAQGATVQRLMAPDGTYSPLTTPSGPIDGPVTGVAGDRLVVAHSRFGQPVTEVRHRLLTDASWSTLSVPSEQVFLDHTRDGVVVRAADAPYALGLLPWSGGAVQPITGLPAGVGGYAEYESRAVDGSRILLAASGADASGGARVLVDTAGRSGRLLSTSNASCPMGRGNAWSINGDRVAWEGLRDGSLPPVICTLTLGGPETVTSRAGVARPRDTYDWQRRLLPVGDTVLVSGTWNSTGWGENPGSELIAVSPDGGRRELAGWGRSVVPMGPGHVLAVTGEEPGAAVVADVDVASGASTTVRAVEPISAWHHGVAVDDDRVVTSDDSTWLGGVRERTVDFTSRLAGASELLDTVAGARVAAGEGGTAWSKTNAVGRHLSSTGVLRDGMPGVTGTDDRWVAAGRFVYDTVTGELREPYVRYASDVVLQDGVTYVPGKDVPGGSWSSVVATDLATGRAHVIPVGCDVYRLQVAGSWLLVECSVAYQQPNTVLVDLAGARPATAPFLRDGALTLGNDFLVKQYDDAYTWKPLTTGWQGDPWRPLTTHSAAMSDDFAISVSRGQHATVAWVAGRRAYAARLPGVTPSPLPAKPATVAPPSEPVLTSVSATDRGVVARWQAAPAGDQVLLTQLVASREYEEEESEQASGSTSGHVGDLVNGRTYDVTLTAWNAAGGTTSRTVQVTPVARPEPTNVQVRIDGSTGRADVTWDLTTPPNTEAPRSFSVVAGSGSVRDLPATARSASFVVPLAATAKAVVTAHGAEQDGIAESAPVSFPGTPVAPTPVPAPDTTRPSVALTGLQTITLTRTARVVLSASDDRALPYEAVEVRMRNAYSGRKLGPWSISATRHAPGEQELFVNPVGTTCYSARARDAAGNVSDWTAPSCTTTPFDDIDLKKSGPAKRLTGPQYAGGTATVLTRRTSSLTPRMWVPSNGYLVATTCSTCGSVRVSVAGRSQGVLSLKSKTIRHQQLLRLPGPKNRFGKLVLQPASKKPVTIDGVVLLGN